MYINIYIYIYIFLYIYMYELTVLVTTNNAMHIMQSQDMHNKINVGIIRKEIHIKLVSKGTRPD